MEITIPIGQILSFDWLNWRTALVVNVLYGVIAHYRGLYYARKWNNNPESRNKIRELNSRPQIEFREITKIDMLKAFGLYMVAMLPCRLLWAGVRISWNVVLRPLSYVVVGLVCLSLPKLPTLPSWKKMLREDCWLRADDQNLLYLPCLYQLLLEKW